MALKRHQAKIRPPKPSIPRINSKTQFKTSNVNKTSNFNKTSKINFLYVLTLINSSYCFASHLNLRSLTNLKPNYSSNSRKNSLSENTSNFTSENNTFYYGSSLTSSLLKHTITRNLKDWASDSSDMQWEPGGGEYCPPLPEPDDGQLACSDGFKKKSVCEYECGRGFVTSGKSKRRCKCDKETGRCYWKGAAFHGVAPKCITCDDLEFEDHYNVDHEKHAITYGYHSSKPDLKLAFIQCKQPYTLAHDGRARGYIRARCKCTRKLGICRWAGVNVPRCEMQQYDETKHCDRKLVSVNGDTANCLNSCGSSLECSTWYFDKERKECFHDLCSVADLPGYFDEEEHELLRGNRWG